MYLFIIHAESAECGLKRFASKIDQSIYQQDLRSAAIYSAFLTINSNIHTTSSAFT